MSGRRKGDGPRVSHEDAKAIRRAVQWLAKIGRLDELQRAVGADLADILDEALTTRAVVNIRLVNCGRPGPRPRRVWPEWTGADFDALDELWRTGVAIAAIADALGREEADVTNEVKRLGMYGSRPRPNTPRMTRYNTNPARTRFLAERLRARTPVREEVAL